MDKTRSQEKTIWLVRFELGGETWGIRFSDIQEILEKKEITPVPQAPSFIFGITHNRGKIITVIDLGLLFGETQREAKASKIIQLKSTKLDIGLLIMTKISSVLLPEQGKKTNELVGTDLTKGVPLYKQVIRKGKTKINVLETEQLIASLEHESFRQ